MHITRNLFKLVQFRKYFASGRTSGDVSVRYTKNNTFNFSNAISDAFCVLHGTHFICNEYNFNAITFSTHTTSTSRVKRFIYLFNSFFK